MLKSHEVMGSLFATGTKVASHHLLFSEIPPESLCSFFSQIGFCTVSVKMGEAPNPKPNTKQELWREPENYRVLVIPAQPQNQLWQCCLSKSCGA